MNRLIRVNLFVYMSIYILAYAQTTIYIYISVLWSHMRKYPHLEKYSRIIYTFKHRFRCFVFSYEVSKNIPISFVFIVYFLDNSLFVFPWLSYLWKTFVILLTNPSVRAGYDTRSIFKRSLTGFNSEFSFS